MEAEQLEQLETIVGSGLTLLLISKESAEEHLCDQDAIMRYGAIVLLAYHWKPNEQFKIKCEEIAFHDPDSMVRTAAVGALGTSYACTRSQRIGQLLINVVRDEKEKYAIRRTAYGALLRVFDKGETIKPGLLELKIPEDIDWEFLSSIEG